MYSCPAFNNYFPECLGGNYRICAGPECTGYVTTIGKMYSCVAHLLDCWFCRKSIKLYGDFYSSDMIVASPVGLITVSTFFLHFNLRLMIFAMIRMVPLLRI